MLSEWKTEGKSQCRFDLVLLITVYAEMILEALGLEATAWSFFRFFRIMRLFRIVR